MLYEFKKQLKATEGIQCSAFGEDDVCDEDVQYWFRRFINGYESTEDDNIRLILKLTVTKKI